MISPRLKRSILLLAVTLGYSGLFACKKHPDQTSVRQKGKSGDNAAISTGDLAKKETDATRSGDAVASKDGLLGQPSSKPDDTSPSSSVELAVVAFAESKMGQRVGNGQCTELAVAALNAAGVTGRYPAFNGGGSYKWGNHIVQLKPGSSLNDLAKIKPGYVLQLERVSANGMFAPHHTQVAVANLGNGVIVVNEQNMSGKMVVTKRNWEFKAMRSGTVDVWSPSL